MMMRYPRAAARGKTDTGVTRSRLDNHGALLELATLFGIVEHSLRHAILHGTGGVEVFKLGKDPGAEAFFNVGEFKKRGVTDQLVCRGINL